LGKDATLVFNSSLVHNCPVFVGRSVELDANTIATQVGVPAAVNMASLGAVIAVKGLIGPASVRQAIADFLGDRKATLVPANFKAYEAGAKAISTFSTRS
jgi:Pyruvate/2-oxoacid:ferredoxin oxidoreductase gamma subunit